MHRDVVMNCSFSWQKKKLFYSESEETEISFFVPIFRNVTRYETPARERVFFASYSPNLYYCSRRSGVDTFILASFNGIKNCSHKKIKLFYIYCFFLFAADDIKMNDLELHFCKVFRYKCFCKKNLIVGTLICLLERIYLKDIYKKGLKVWSEILNLL